MLDTICAEIRNYFTYDKDKHIGDFAIIGGVITPSFDIATDYIRIVGSHKNDGVHKRGTEGFSLVDEPEFHGAIWVMSPPAAFLLLVAEIDAWQAKYGSVNSEAMSPFNSESFAGYSYTKGSRLSNSNSNGGYPTWQSIYASRLNPYRRIRVN